MRIALEIFLLLVFTFANASRCPESRKPHVTSCVIFYNCINLPEGGYVWAPARCADGLVFQPSLRLCVLPGDTWTCDVQRDQPLIHSQPSIYSTELVDNSRTSYDGIYADSEKKFGDILYKINDTSNLGNVLMTIPYPVIEISEKLNEGEKHNINSDVSPIPAKRLDDHLLNMKHNPEYIPVTLIKVKNNDNDKVPNFKPFFNRIFLYQHIAPSLKQQTFVSSPSIDYSTVTNNEYINSDIMNYFIENYIFKRISESVKLMNKTDMVMKMKMATGNMESTTEQMNFVSTTEKNRINVNEVDELTNILAINGNFGRKEYVTVEKYRSSTDQINIEIIAVIPCMKARRLANSTDCMRYYTCNPMTAEIHEYICPPNTAFNSQKNLCDSQKYRVCKRNRNSDALVTMKLQKKDSVDDIKDGVTTAKMELCETTGKFADETSEKFYYLCYTSSNSDKIESLKLACPNELIFCQDTKMCTSKRLCDDYN